MNQEDFDLTINFIVESNLPVEKITSMMEIEPNEIVPKGTVSPISHCIRNTNLWCLFEKYRGIISMDGLVESFLKRNKIDSHKVQALNACKENMACYVRISIVSLYAQIGYVLSLDDIAFLATLGIKVVFSIFSWGGVQNDEED